MEPTYTYKLLPHEGVTHLVLNGRNYQLDKLTEADMAVLYGKTSFIKRTVFQAEQGTKSPLSVPIRRKRIN